MRKDRTRSRCQHIPLNARVSGQSPRLERHGLRVRQTVFTMREDAIHGEWDRDARRDEVESKMGPHQAPVLAPAVHQMETRGTVFEMFNGSPLPGLTYLSSIHLVYL